MGITTMQLPVIRLVYSIKMVKLYIVYCSVLYLLKLHITNVYATTDKNMQWEKVQKQ